MKRLLLVKFAAEIFLKGLNKGKFEKKLMDNIKASLIGVQYEFEIDYGRCFISTEDIDEAVKRVKKIFGVSGLCIVTQVESDFEEIKLEAIRQLEEKKFSTFKVETKRAVKTFPMDSMEVSRKLGGLILDAMPEKKVDVIAPELKLYVEIRTKTYIYSDIIKAIGGLPYGMNGSTMLMLSGGIDSPVAGYLMARRGVELSCVYYHSHPYTSERAKDKVKTLADILRSYTGKLKLYVVPFTHIQMEIVEKCREDEITILMRRFMMRVACTLAEKNGIQSVTTGESMGQVASQTMESIVVTDIVSTMPCFRPLISTDKIDIMDIAREIDTYETSILPYEDCCTIFVAKHPKTKPRLKDIEFSEEKLEVDMLVKEAIDGIEVYC